MERALLFSILLLPFAPSAAAAQDWFPLEPGLYWDYFDPALSKDFRVEIDGTQEIRARTTTRRIVRELPGPVDEFRNYWSQDAQGRVYLHGFWRPNQEVGVAYEPPLLWYDPTVYPVGAWATTVAVHDFLTGELLGSFRNEGRPEGTVEVTVPAGTFSARRWSADDVPLPVALPGLEGVRLNVTGAVTGAAGAREIVADYVTWLVADVGIVQEARALESVVIRTLVDSNVPVAVEPRSWSSVKSLYRGAPR